MDQLVDFCDQKDAEIIQKTLSNLPEDVAQSEIESPAPMEADIMLSKRQKKRILKSAGWEEKKMDLRAREKEKCRAKRKDMRERGEERKGPSRKTLKSNKVEISNSPYHVAVDCSYDDLMIDKDISKCVKQLLRVYTENRRSISPINIYFTGIKSTSRTHNILERHAGFRNWDVKFEEEPFDKVFDKDRLIFLTSESDNVLTTLEEHKVYVIGGLVDHNSHKGLCFKIANERGINHARLPLSENIEIKTRTVLTINHVFEILLGVSLGETWPDILLKTLPQRKGCKPKVPKVPKAPEQVNQDENSTKVPLEESKDENVDQSMKNLQKMEQIENYTKSENSENSEKSLIS